MASLTTIAATDKISDSRTDINNNFSGISSGDIALATPDLGAATATSFGGITEANLLDKSANEILTGIYTFEKPTGGNGILYLDDYSVSSSETYWLLFRKSHQSTKGYTTTVDGENLGKIAVRGVDSGGSSWSGTCAEILFAQDGNAGATYIPGKISLRTGTDAAGVSDALTLDSSQNATFAGTLGCGAITSSGVLTVTNASAPILATRATTETSTIRNSLQIEHLTTNDMVDGFGPGMYFIVTDSGASNQTIGLIAAVRDGADNSGALEFWTGTNASTKALTLDSSQNATFAGTIGCGAITSSGIFDLNNTLDLNVGVTATTDAANITIDENSVANVTAYVTGLQIQVDENIDTGHTNSGYIYGSYINSALRGAGNVVGCSGMKIQYGNESGGTGTITTGIGLEILPRQAGGGTITTNYGLKIGDMVGTTKYAIYTGTGDVRLGGELNLAGTSRVAGDPTTDGYFVIKIGGTSYKVPCLAA